ncbi:hypothetical protein TSUD_316350 [Trifolium subterraneum]|uniref:Uncharacterized protein n=1 Tax=Trifolium subterraneum TaxID=3900 RepID=A0A2Z6NYA7_TRISU|nr:hypothetical protein TSUD_316350 [Trifolium subterraneum]
MRVKGHEDGIVKNEDTKDQRKQKDSKLTKSDLNHIIDHTIVDRTFQLLGVGILPVLMTDKLWRDVSDCSVNNDVTFMPFSPSGV